MNSKTQQFKQALDNHHQWPCPYIFKFIVPAGELETLTALFPGESLQTRESKTGKFVSVTMESTMCSSEGVLEIYERAATVPGLMAL